MGRGGNEAGDVVVAPEALLYGRRQPRLFRDKYIDGERPGRRARRVADKITNSYRDGDMKGFLLGLRNSTVDRERLPDASTPLLLEVYRLVSSSDVGKEAAKLDLPEGPDEEELEGMFQALVPQIHQRIGALQEILDIRDDASLGNALLRRGDIEDASYRVEGKFSEHYCGKLAAEDNVMILSSRARASIINGEALPAAKAAFHEALRRFIVVQANVGDERSPLLVEKMERSRLSVYAEGGGKVHISADGDKTVCGMEVESKAQIGSWRDVDYPGCIWQRCWGCQKLAHPGLLGKAQDEWSDTSPRLEGHPALQGTPVDDFIDEIALSPEVTKVLRESVEPQAERAYEKLCTVVRSQLLGIEPLNT